MKLLTTLIVIALLGVGGWYVYTRVLMPPEKRACSRLSELCGESKGGERCHKGMEEFRKVAGQEAFKNATGCIDKADSCMGAVGCVVRAKLSGLGDFLKGMVDGMGPDLHKKGKELMDKLKHKLDDK